MQFRALTLFEGVKNDVIVVGLLWHSIGRGANHRLRHVADIADAFPAGKSISNSHYGLFAHAIY